MIGIWNGDQSSKMKNNVHSCTRRPHTVLIPDVTCKNLDPFLLFLIEGIYPSPAIERIIKDKRFYVTPFFQQAFYQMATDKSISTGHQYLFALKDHKLVVAIIFAVLVL